MDDTERLDCGHYEFLAKAEATPGGFLICRGCWSRILLAKEAPYIERRPELSWFGMLRDLLFSAISRCRASLFSPFYSVR